MPTRFQTPAGFWHYPTTFFWATTGATVGLSNLWTFPRLAGENGGGLFILFYIACLLVITLPLMLTESVIGRGARHGPVLAIDALARQAGAPLRWLWTARLSLIAGFLVLSFYLVVGGICLAYVFYGALGRFNNASAGDLSGVLTSLVQDPDNYRVLMGWHLLFVGLVVVVSMQGVLQGIERSLRVVVPLLILLLLGLLIYSVRFGNIQGSMDYVLAFKPEQVSLASVRLALTHAFYTLVLGMGVLIIFGAYSAPETPLKRSVLAVALVDTLVGIIAGVIVYAIVFNNGGESLEGFPLAFMAIPESLAQMAGGQFVTTVFFVILVLAAWSSSIALLEPGVAWLQERIASPRGWSVLLIGMCAWALGLVSLFSFNIWSDYTFMGGTAYRWLELVTSTLIIPVVSILLGFFIGWALPDDMAHQLIGRGPVWVRQVWQWVIRLVLPAVLLYTGIHYAIDSAGSLCAGNQSPFWCSHPSDPADTVLPDSTGAHSGSAPDVPDGIVRESDGSESNASGKHAPTGKKDGSGH